MTEVFDRLLRLTCKNNFLMVYFVNQRRNSNFDLHRNRKYSNTTSDKRKEKKKNIPIKNNLFRTIGN